MHRVIDNIQRTQDALGCQISLENPYTLFADAGT
ncbi:Uncharacterised protein [Cedecea neteri]|uniref:Uncharacterized protein n=1 Tax=Cedecea neteri TaxID=158822 RepID=A0A2X2SVD0_9ENTR|nr:Uncharacterised protein [Cedecea neteri]